jgi:RND family efflux transporter MFP subunit
MDRFARSVAAGAIALLCAALAGCGEGGPPPRAAAPVPPVTVVRPVQRTVVDYDEYVGRFVAVDSVELRLRVSGYLQTVHFTDGQIVKKGDLLFTIDRRPFQMALNQARAMLAQARANLAFTENDLARAQQLVRDKTITEQVFEQRTQAKRVSEAAVQANEALVQQAELDYQEFSEMRAPITGRIGDRRVSPGNLVTGGTGGNTTLLATIVSIDPIRFEFTFDEASYLRYERAQKGAGRGSAETPVKLKLIDEADFTHDGHIDFVDNAISQTSGTIRGRAVFSNPNGLLTPGMFGRLQVPGSAPYPALLVEDKAIGTEQAKKFVYVADASDTARQTYVTLGPISEGLRVIRSGLAADDRVIVDGLTLLRAGTKVSPKEAAPTSISKAE